MAWLRSSVGQTAFLGLFGAALLGNACSNDSSVEFAPGPVDASEGATDAGGTPPTSSGSHSGATASTGGNSSAGSSAEAGSESTGGSGAGGHGSGGQSLGGQSGNAGTSAGGKGGTNAAGAAGKGGTSAGGAGGAGGGGAGGGGAGGGGAGGGGAGGGNGGNGGATGGNGGASGNGGTSSCVPKTEVCDGADNDCDKVADPPGTCPEGCTGAAYGGHTYLFCGLVDSALAALAKCNGANMNVVSIESAAENDFVRSKQKGSSWLGGTDEGTEKTWHWVPSNTVFWSDGPVAGVYQNWLAGQPNDNGMMGAQENCLVLLSSGMAVQDAKWNDLACTLSGFRAACESAGPVNPPVP